MCLKEDFLIIGFEYDKCEYINLFGGLPSIHVKLNYRRDSTLEKQYSVYGFYHCLAEISSLYHDKRR